MEFHNKEKTIKTQVDDICDAVNRMSDAKPNDESMKQAKEATGTCQKKIHAAYNNPNTLGNQKDNEIENINNNRPRP